ncbi:unnamed protein product [Pieris macdunnoughi]|uniref:Reverse transcriptase domain-containing protein n=1 Tax=Pieris macdunnoughi TaxID=345717 RepID=A0A821T0A5_9NEOP|nr:unnamed protein product [Pieris macdunnoughi]
MFDKSLTLFYQNVRGLRTKSNEFYQNLLTCTFDVILITESWLNSSFYDNELCSDEYQMFRRDRSKETSSKNIGGGLLIYVSRYLKAYERAEWNCNSVETLWITIPHNSLAVNDRRSLHIGLVYIPPDSMQAERLETFISSFSHIMDTNISDNFIIVGDFNLPNINWTPLGPILLKKGTSKIQNVSEIFLNEINISGLKQHNVSSNSSNNVLDLILSNVSIDSSTTDMALVKPDIYHPCLKIDATDLVLCKTIPKAQIKYNFRRANYEDINKALSNIDWVKVLIGGTIDEVTGSFYVILDKIISSFVPKSRSIGRSKFPIWYSSSLKHIIKDKLKAHKRWKTYRNPRDYDEFSLLRARQKLVSKKCFDMYEKSIQNNLSKDPKALWSYLRNKRQCSPGYPNTMILGDEVYYTEADACEGFNRFFKSVFQHPDDSYNLQHLPESDYTCNQVVLTEDEVCRELKSLNINKGSGSDGIPSIFLQKCYRQLSKPLTNIFNQSLNVFCSFPSKWKEAHIVPIHKKGSRNKIEHYRPISILNSFGKLFEKLVNKTLSPLILRQLPHQQHGFTKNRSTVSNLTVFTEYILKGMDEGEQIDAIYTDFEKAFDRVDHVILLHKLLALGIRGDLYRWIKSYVTNRRQAVVMGGHRSTFINVTSGVPQGSILGPLLFNAYLYDIQNCFKYSEYLMFADDKKIFLKIKSIENCVQLQQDLSRLEIYYKRNKLSLNIGKCSKITFTRKHKKIQFCYKIRDTTIKQVNLVGDLGILLDDKMSFSEHIDNITEKAYKQLGFVKRVCKSFRNIKCIKCLYFAFVRSTLEYACTVWSPTYKKYIEAIENIQIKFLKFLSFKDFQKYSSYIDSCKYFGIESLECRRKQYDLIFLHAICNGLIDCPDLLPLLLFHAPSSHNTRQTQLFKIPRFNSNYLRNSVMHRIPSDYNRNYQQIEIFNVSKKCLRNDIKNLVSFIR